MFDNILTCQWKNGQTKHGVDEGAYKIKNYIQTKFIDFDFRNYVDIIDSNESNESYHYKVYKQHLQCVGNTLSIGGDHSIAIGTVLSSLSKNISTCVIWIDAHPDIHTFKSSVSGNVHGMPLSFITNNEKSWKWTKNLNKLKFENIFYFGLRDIDDYELNIIKSNQIKILHNIDQIKNIYDKFDNIHISFDVDSIDPIYIPSTGTSCDYGIELSEILDLFKYIKENTLLNKHKTINFDIVEYNPSIGSFLEKATSETNIQILVDSLI